MQSGLTVPLSIPYLSGNELEYLQECIETNWVAQGPFIERFENAISGRLGGINAVASSSGTAALHLALIVAGIQPGDEVLVPSLTFVASANAIRYVGAHPVFVDAEPDFGQFSIAKAAAFLQDQCEVTDDLLRNTMTGRPVRAILPVHILGHPVEMIPVLEMARTFGLTIIEDATEALGAAYMGQPVGTHGDIACFSFNGNKTITAGGGGMVVTKRSDWAARARYLSDQAKDDPIASTHSEVGFNYRLSNLHAAIGVAQMEMLDEILNRKRAISARYASAFSSVQGVTPITEADWATSNFWLNAVSIDENAFGLSSAQLRGWLASEGIETRPLWQPLHMSPAYVDAQHTACEVAEALHRAWLCLPSSAGLSLSDQERVIEALTRAGQSSS